MVLLLKILAFMSHLVPFDGRHSCKQFMRAKPIRFGYKLWVLASATRVPYKIETYQRRINQGRDEPLGTRVVKNALDHSVYFDNFFSSYSLICDLVTKRFRSTDTMRNNRIMNFPLADVKKNEEKRKGTF